MFRIYILCVCVLTRRFVESWPGRAHRMMHDPGRSVRGWGGAVGAEDAARAGRGSGCPGFSDQNCQCPDYRIAYNISTYTQYERVYLESVSSRVFSLEWSELYTSGAGIGEVTISFFEDDNGLPGAPIYVGTNTGGRFVIEQTLDPTSTIFGLDVYNMRADFQNVEPTLQDYSAQCIHISISHTDIPGGSLAFWATSESDIGDQRHLSVEGAGALPGFEHLGGDDLHLCLDTVGNGHVLGAMLDHCPPNVCTLAAVDPAIQLLENEPDCAPSGNDSVNGGCNSSPYMVSELPAGKIGIGSARGSLVNAQSQFSRDTDWWRIAHPGGELSVGLLADFAAHVVVWAEPDLGCQGGSDISLLNLEVAECVSHELSVGVVPAGNYIAFVAYSPWSEYRFLSCGEASYRVWNASFGFGCAGDANGDGQVDVTDIGYVLFRLGDPCAGPGCDGDANGDGQVDVTDIGYVLFRLGDPC